MPSFVRYEIILGWLYRRLRYDGRDIWELVL